MYLGKLIDKGFMKFFKKINVSSDGSLYFNNKSEILNKNSFVLFKKNDDKNFGLYQKKLNKVTSSKQSLIYKSKFL